MKDFGQIAILYGGESNEREISLQSGKAVYDALRAQGLNCELIDPANTPLILLANKGIDLAFIALHGGIGENGSVQAFLENLGISYTGPDQRACVIAYDKILSKWIWQAHNLPVAKAVVLTSKKDLDICTELGYPFFLKPPCEGSSVGVHKIKNKDELHQVSEKLFKYYPSLLAEQYLRGGEYSCLILGDQALPVVKIEPANDFYDYEAKYSRDDTVYFCPAGLSQQQEKEARELALLAFQACGCSNWGRVDLMKDEHGRFHILELNVSPGMTSHSLAPMSAKEAGLSFAELCLSVLCHAK